MRPLVPLPFTTFGDIVDAGWQVGIYCPGCYRTTPIQQVSAWSGNVLRGLCAFHARFRCHKMRPTTRQRCENPGYVQIEPPRAPMFGEKSCTLWCGGVRPWQINRVVLGTGVFPAMDGDARFQCPGCRGAVQWSWPSGDASGLNAAHLSKPGGRPEF